MLPLICKERRQCIVIPQRGKYIIESFAILMHLFNLIADLRKKFMENRSNFACLGSLTPSKFLGLYTATKTLDNKTFQTIQSNRLSQNFFFFYLEM